MKITALDHVQLAMPAGREAAARAFYEGVLGVPEVQKPPILAKRGGCWFERDAVKIHLGVEADFRPARKAHPALLVEDLEALKASLEAAGFLPRSDEPLTGYDRVYVDDPFGNRIELLELSSH
jgi:catechol 2,3-dioxygenase-like lactoylglutathione lyase family enzyme